MCIAIFKPEKKRIFKKTLQNCFIHHSDGAGFLVHDAQENKLILHKGFFSFNEFWQAIRPFMLSRMLIHFRKATHGEKDKENCHPFLINDELGFMHNGIIKEVRQWNKEMSDTWHFGEAIIKPLVKEFPDIWKNDVMKLILEEYIGKSSKLIFMNNNGEISIVNEKAGNWENECWFSNSSYQKTPVEKKDDSIIISGPEMNKAYSEMYSRNYNGFRKDETALQKDDTINANDEIKSFYNGYAKTPIEIMLESLFKECEEEELERDEAIKMASVREEDFEIVGAP